MYKNYLKKFLGFIDVIGQKNIFNFRNVSIERGCKIDVRKGRLVIGERVKFGRYSSIYAQGGNIGIGNNVSVRQSSIIYGFGDIEIGDGVRIGPNVVITSHNHGYDGVNPVGELSAIGEKVIIGRNCWIGANCVLLPGVKLLPGSILGAGSVLPKGEYGGKIIFKRKPS